MMSSDEQLTGASSGAPSASQVAGICFASAPWCASFFSNAHFNGLLAPRQASSSSGVWLDTMIDCRMLQYFDSEASSRAARRSETFSAKVKRAPNDWYE